MGKIKNVMNSPEYKEIEKDVESFVQERLKNYIPADTGKKTIHDPVWGSIDYSEWEMQLIDSPLFQRLRDINQVGFIINMENDLAKELRKNSVFKDYFNKEYAFEFIGERAKDKFKEEGFTSDFFLRADYLIFGVPRCLIEGIVVGREVESNLNYLKQLKDLFKDCYICNLEGKVIY